MAFSSNGREAAGVPTRFRAIAFTALVLSYLGRLGGTAANLEQAVVRQLGFNCGI